MSDGMDENKFWFSIWSLVATVVIVLITTIGLSSVASERAMLQMVEKGADPVKARCAVYGSGERNAAMCTLAVK